MDYDFVDTKRRKIALKILSDSIEVSIKDKNSKCLNKTYNLKDINSVSLGYNESIGYLCRLHFADELDLKIRSTSLILDKSNEIVKNFKNHPIEYLDFVLELHNKLKDLGDDKLVCTAGSNLKTIFLYSLMVYFAIAAVFFIYIGQYKFILLPLIFIPFLHSTFGKLQLKQSYPVGCPPQDFLPKI